MDKRGCRRLPIKVGCWMVELDAITCIQTFDMSDEGVSVLCDEPLPVGKALSLRFFTPHSADPVLVEAEVVWNRESGTSYAAGLRFIAMDQKVRRMINEFTAMLQERARSHSRE